MGFLLDVGPTGLHIHWETDTAVRKSPATSGAGYFLVLELLDCCDIDTAEQPEDYPGRQTAGVRV